MRNRRRPRSRRRPTVVGRTGAAHDGLGVDGSAAGAGSSSGSASGSTADSAGGSNSVAVGIRASTNPNGSSACAMASTGGGGTSAAVSCVSSNTGGSVRTQAPAAVRPQPAAVPRTTAELRVPAKARFRNRLRCFQRSPGLDDGRGHFGNRPPMSRTVARRATASTAGGAISATGSGVSNTGAGVSNAGAGGGGSLQPAVPRMTAELRVPAKAVPRPAPVFRCRHGLDGRRAHFATGPRLEHRRGRFERRRRRRLGHCRWQLRCTTTELRVPAKAFRHRLRCFERRHGLDDRGASSATASRSRRQARVFRTRAPPAVRPTGNRRGRVPTATELPAKAVPKQAPVFRTPPRPRRPAGHSATVSGVSNTGAGVSNAAPAAPRPLRRQFRSRRRNLEFAGEAVPQPAPVFRTPHGLDDRRERWLRHICHGVATCAAGCGASKTAGPGGGAIMRGGICARGRGASTIGGGTRRNGCNTSAIADRVGASTRSGGGAA